jgi:predicted RNA-binding Zn-ribbon protein involved in translation (DUF1610 family)
MTRITDSLSVSAAELEITCPDCNGALRVPESATEFPCPHCRRELEITLSEAGLVLVGTRAGGQTRTPRPVPPSDDPVLQDLAKWQTGAVFALIGGAAMAGLIALAVLRDLSAHGASFFTRTQNLIIPSVMGAVGILCLAGGIWVLYSIRKERQRYDIFIRETSAGRTPPPAVDGDAGHGPRRRIEQ